MVDGELDVRITLWSCRTRVSTGAGAYLRNRRFSFVTANREAPLRGKSLRFIYAQSLLIGTIPIIG